MNAPSILARIVYAYSKESGYLRYHALFAMDKALDRSFYNLKKIYRKVRAFFRSELVIIMVEISLHVRVNSFAITRVLSVLLLSHRTEDYLQRLPRTG